MKPLPSLVLLVSMVICRTPSSAADFPDLEGIKAIGLSSVYSLEVDEVAVPVLETRKTTNHGTNDISTLSFAGFDCDSRVQIELHVQRAFESVELRPRRSEVEITRNSGVLRFELEPNQQIVLAFDDQFENALVIAANPTHVPPDPAEVTHFFAPGVHRLEDRLALASGDRVYLAEGAVVLGAFDIHDASDVRIEGRGIIYGGEEPHEEAYKVFSGSNTKKVTIEGITVCNAPGWIVSFWNGSEDLTIRNVKMVGNFRYNTDGVQTGTSGLLVENCFLQCNDDNFSLNGVCTDVTIRNNVLWNLYNGGVFMMGWATGPNFRLERLRIHDNTVVRCGGCCDYDRKAPISMKLFGSRRTAQDIEFKNLVLEEIVAFGRWIDLQASKANESTVSDIRFQNIQIDETWLLEGEVRGMGPDNPIRNLSFENVRIGETLMDSPEVGKLTLIDTIGTTIEGTPFVDVQIAKQPIPESDREMATRLSQSQSGALGDESGAPSGNTRVNRAKPLREGANLLPNGGFTAGLDGWLLPREDLGMVELQDETHLPLISNRRDGSVGISIDITELLREHGPGHYYYGVVAKAASESLHIKATIMIQEAGTQALHPSPDELIGLNDWGVAARDQLLQWTELEKATLRVESGYGDNQDVILKEVFLKK